jgi:hypothetical protein
LTLSSDAGRPLGGRPEFIPTILLPGIPGVGDVRRPARTVVVIVVILVVAAGWTPDQITMVIYGLAAVLALLVGPGARRP